jgi:hypothetical protein
LVVKRKKKTIERKPAFLDMNKCEQIGAEDLLSMLTDIELMSVKDTVTKSMIPTNSVRKTKFLFLVFFSLDLF